MVVLERASLTVAVAQPVGRVGDLASNAAAHREAIRRAEARLVVFPELSLTGYDLNAPTIELSDPALATIAAACEASESVALVGAPVRVNDTDRIATIILRPAAPPTAITTVTPPTVAPPTVTEVASASVAYTKMCLGDAEVGRFTAGTAPACIEVDGWRVALGICKDTRMADHLDPTLAMNPDLYVAGLVHHHHETDELAERAINIASRGAIPVAFASAAGYAGPSFPQAAGHSAIWSSDGDLLTAPTGSPGVATTRLRARRRRG